MAWYEPRATPPTPPPRRRRRRRRAEGGDDVWNEGHGLVPEEDCDDDDDDDDENEEDDCPGALQRRIEHLLSAAAVAVAPSSSSVANEQTTSSSTVTMGAAGRRARPPSPRPAYRHRHPPAIVVDVVRARRQPSAPAGGGGGGGGGAGRSPLFPGGFLSPPDPAVAVAAPPSHRPRGGVHDGLDRHPVDERHGAGGGAGRGFPGGGQGQDREYGDATLTAPGHDRVYGSAPAGGGRGGDGGFLGGNDAQRQQPHRRSTPQPSLSSFSASSSSQSQQHHHHPDPHHRGEELDDNRRGGGGVMDDDEHHRRPPNFYRAHFQSELPPSQPRRNYTQLTLHRGGDGGGDNTLGLSSSTAAAAASEHPEASSSQRNRSRQECDAVGRIGPAALSSTSSTLGANSQRERGEDDVPLRDRNDRRNAADEGGDEVEGGRRRKRSKQRRKRLTGNQRKKRNREKRDAAAGQHLTQQLLPFKENNGVGAPAAEAEADVDVADSDGSDVWEGGGGGRGGRSKKSKRRGDNRGGDETSLQQVEPPIPVGRGVRSKKGRRRNFNDHPESRTPPLVLTEESFAGLEDPNVGILNAGGSLEALREFKRLCDMQPHVAWTVVYLDRNFTTPFLPGNRRYCTDKGPTCVDWNCTCDSQVRGASRSRAPLVGAMFVFPRAARAEGSGSGGGGGGGAECDAVGDDDGGEERHTCFVLPLGRTTDTEGAPERLPDDDRAGGGPGVGAYRRMADWPLIPFNCDAPIERRWDVFRSILTQSGRSGRGPKCVTYNAIPSLLPFHRHRSMCPSASGDGVAMMDLILPAVWDLKLAAWVLRPHASGDELEFDSIVAGFPHLRPRATSVPRGASDQLRGLIGCRDGLAFLADVYPAVSGAVSGKGLDDALDQIEGPLQGVLAAMECHGIGILPNRLSNIQRRLERRCDELTVEARAIAGDDTFLLSSPQQVAHLLFDVLRIAVPPGSQVSSGSQQQASNRSTSEAVLEAIQQTSPHRIVQILLEFRGLNKLLTTYIRPLPNLARVANSDDISSSAASTTRNGTDITDGGGGCGTTIMRIHPMWMQTSVRTGRLSCRRPNMQQIPKGGNAFGVVPRDAFCASSPDLCLFACDYSQNEVRILAHVSGDGELISMFGNEHSVDIYRQMSGAITGKSMRDVSDGERAIAKQVVLAILYGMGVPQVAKKLKVNRDTAQRFFTSFFDRFRQVRNWIERTKEDARRNGYVTTIVGRRRYLDEIHSGDGSKRAQAERQAVNSVIQGSAADLMKLAMLKIASRIVDWHKEGVNAGGTGIAPRIILQIHDELLFEVMANSADVGRLKEAVIRCCAVECERDLKLKVPLKLTCSVGKSWGKAMKDLP